MEEFKHAKKVGTRQVIKPIGIVNRRRVHQQFLGGGDGGIAVFAGRDFLEHPRQIGNLNAARRDAQHFRQRLFPFGAADFLQRADQSQTQRRRHHPVGLQILNAAKTSAPAAGPAGKSAIVIVLVGRTNNIRLVGGGIALLTIFQVNIAAEERPDGRHRRLAALRQGFQLVNDHPQSRIAPAAGAKLDAEQIIENVLWRFFRRCRRRG